nr:hypothetical protein [Tanacetum cinerariifolium]
MTSFDYRLNPLYTIKECSSCKALYTTDYCCSNGSLVDKINCDLNKAPDSPHLHTCSSNQRHCFQCKDVLGDGEFCQRCTCIRCGSGLSEGLCLICGNNQNSLNDSPSAHKGYNCPPKVSVISNPEPWKNQTIDELPQAMPSFHPTFYTGDESPFTCDSTPNIVDDSPNVFNPPPQSPNYSYEFCGNDAYYGHDCPHQQLPVIDQTPLEEIMKNLRIAFQAWSENIQQKKEEEEKQIAEEQAAKARYWNIPICYDDEEDYTIAITPKEPNNSLNIRDEHRNTIPATESDEFIKSSVENLVPNPSESEGEHECDVPACDDFTTFSNILFEADDDFSSSDDEFFDYFFFFKIDSLLDEFAGELIPLKTIPPGIDKADYDPKEEIHLIEKLFDPLMKEIDLFLASDGSIPLGIDNDYSDSEGDNLFLERLLHDDPIPLLDTLDFSNVIRVFLPFFTYPDPYAHPILNHNIIHQSRGSCVVGLFAVVDNEFE